MPTQHSTLANGGSSRVQQRTLSAEWNNLVTDVEELIKKVADAGDVEIGKARARVEKTLAAAKNTAVNSVGTVRDYARNATHVTDTYVHDKPWTAVGLAAGIGVLIGLLASRR